MLIWKIQVALSNISKSKLNLIVSIHYNHYRTKAFHESLLTPALGGANVQSSSTSSLRGMFQKMNVESFGLGGGVTNQLGNLFAAVPGLKGLLPTTKARPHFAEFIPNFIRNCM
jgi:hypothetical protein